MRISCTKTQFNRSLLSLVSISTSIFDYVLNLISSLGYLGIFTLMVMDSATLPVPSEVVLPFAGYLVYQGHIEFWPAVVVASVGSLAGTLVDYAIGFYLGRAAILRYGRIVHLNEGHLKTTEKWFNRYGNITVLLARFVPLIRTLVAFPAGIAEMNIGKFVLYSFVGIFAWDAILIYIGEVAGQNSTSIINTLQKYFVPIGIAAIVIIALLVLFRSRGRKNVSSPSLESGKVGKQ